MVRRVWRAVSGSWWGVGMAGVVMAGAVAGFVGVRWYGGVMAGWGWNEWMREPAGEGDQGRSFWVGSVPRRVMVVMDRFGSAYPNDVPEGTPRESKVTWGWFCHRQEMPVGMVAEADPATYPTWAGFGWMDAEVDLSSHSHDYYRALILPDWVVPVAGAVPLVVMGRAFVQRRRRG